MSGVRHRCGSRMLAAVFGGSLCMHVALAAEGVSLGAAQLQGAGWYARGVTLHLATAAQSASAQLRIEELSLPPPAGAVHALSVHCASIEVADQRYLCNGAAARFELADGTRAELHGRVAYAPGARTLELIAQLPDAEGEVLELRIALAPSGWRIDASAHVYALAALAPWLAEFVRWSAQTPPDGRLTLSAHATGHGARVEAWHAQGEIEDLTLSAFDDRLASAALAGMVELDARARADGATDVHILLRARAGQGYVDPWFVDAGAHPFSLRATGVYGADRQQLTLDTLEVDQPGVLVAAGSAVIEPYRVRSLILDLQPAQLPAAYALYLQPLLIGSALDDLETQGRARGRIDIEDGVPASFMLELDELHAEDREGRFGVYGVSGDLRWSRHATTPLVSALRYTGAALYGVPFDAGSMRLASSGTDLRVLDTPLRMPLLEGALVIRTLDLRALGSDDVAADLDAELEPVDVSRLTGALGWVPFAGTLSGRLPTLRYADGVLTLGGALEAEVFGGQIAVEGLRVEQPLGVLPALRADIRMRDIDLERLTGTFSFGHMTGRLHADVLGLEALAWRAERFDARIYTPADDSSTHRISQRAVQSIAAIGGGVSASLPQGFMRFFDEFAYDRVDLSCRMREQVCAMDGIAAKGEGYYILRGKGLPRIDVVGYQRSVSWPALAAAVVQAARSGNVVVD